MFGKFTGEEMEVCQVAEGEEADEEGRDSEGASGGMAAVWFSPRRRGRESWVFGVHFGDAEFVFGKEKRVIENGSWTMRMGGSGLSKDGGSAPRMRQQHCHAMT